MSGGYFDADWLRLREPADRAARPQAALDGLRTWAAPYRTLRVMDLGAGTGANVRYLAPALTSTQQWCLVDQDARLLDHAASALGEIRNAAGAPVKIATLTANLRDIGALLMDAPQLITASALLDLVSGAWLEELARACRRADAAALFALSYDGSMQWDPEDPLDATVRQAVNAHQQRDKGLGPALGPDAARRAAGVFTAAGYRVTLHHSPWLLGPEQGSLQVALLDGWLSAALEQEPARSNDFLDWAVRRHNCIHHSGAHLVVGHQDLLAVPE